MTDEVTDVTLPKDLHFESEQKPYATIFNNMLLFLLSISNADKDIIFEVSRTRWPYFIGSHEIDLKPMFLNLKILLSLLFLTLLESFIYFY